MGKIRKIKANKPSKPTEIQSINEDDDVPRLVSITIPKKSITKGSTPKVLKNPADTISFQKTPQIKKIISKRDKRKQKHKKFQSKIELFKKQSEKESLTKQKKPSLLKAKQQKSNLSSNLKALKDALPSLDELFQFKTKPTDLKTGVAEYDVPKTKNQLQKSNKHKRKREMLQRLKRFNDLLKDPDYQKNARETIANHIKYSRDLSDH